MKPEIQKIQPQHNAAVAGVIRNVLEEHGITMPGTAYHDKSLDSMHAFHSATGSTYFVAIVNNEVVGGSGVYPTNGLPQDTCELVKMYVLKSHRGQGIAKKLLEECMHFARQHGYKKMYLETMPELSSAIDMYAKFGFKRIAEPIGNTGHFACTLRMLHEF